MLPLAGYAERLSARPGQTLRFHVANATGAPVPETGSRRGHVTGTFFHLIGPAA